MELVQSDYQPFLHGNPYSGFSVSNLSKTKDFYQNVLGLHVTEEDMGVLIIHLDYGQKVLMYPKSDHEPASFTIMNFPVPDIDKAVNALKSKGVIFESYDYTDDDNIAREMGPLIAWFKDPSGNILSVIQEDF